MLRFDAHFCQGLPRKKVQCARGDGSPCTRNLLRKLAQKYFQKRLCKSDFESLSESDPVYASSFAGDYCVSVTDWPVAKGALLAVLFSLSLSLLSLLQFQFSHSSRSSKPPLGEKAVAAGGDGSAVRGGREGRLPCKCKRANVREREAEAAVHATDLQTDRQTDRQTTSLPAGRGHPPSLQSATGTAAARRSGGLKAKQRLRLLPSASVEKRQRRRQQRRVREKHLNYKLRWRRRRTLRTGEQLWSRVRCALKETAFVWKASTHYVLRII